MTSRCARKTYCFSNVPKTEPMLPSLADDLSPLTSHSISAAAAAVVVGNGTQDSVLPKRDRSSCTNEIRPRSSYSSW